MKKVIVLATVALMASSASANLLQNGGFDSGTLAPGWTNPNGSGGVWPSGNSGPAWQSGAAAHGGSHYGGVQEGGAQSPKYLQQTVPGLTPGGAYDLQGWMFGGSWNNQHFVAQLIDSDGTTVLDEFRVVFDVTPVGFSWIPFTSGTFNVSGGTGPIVGGGLQGNPTGASLTVRVGWVNSTGAWSNGTGAYFDDMVLTPEPASLALLGLAGIPMLLRRRRHV
jgi:hypothetical protein